MMPDLKLHPGNGVVIGVVKDLEDPLALGRVVVEYPVLDDKQSAYARLVVPMAGKERGTFFRPEVGDEVLVAFEHGEPRRPYVLGSLWSTVDPPPDGQGGKVENDVRVIVSRSGHVVRLDDTPGSEKIEIVDKDGERLVVLSSQERKVRIEADPGEVEIRAASKVTIEAAQGEVEVKAASKVTVTAAQIEVKASGNLELKAGGVLTIQGATVNIN